MSLDQFRPDWIALRNQSAALAIALAGALIARALRLPMPWLLGPMFATGIAAFLGLPLSVNRWVRAIMMMALGVLLGSAFQVELLQRAAQDLPIILMLVPYTLDHHDAHLPVAEGDVAARPGDGILLVGARRRQ